MDSINIYLTQIENIQSAVNQPSGEKVADASQKLNELVTAFLEDHTLRPKQLEWLKTSVLLVSNQLQLISSRIGGSVLPRVPLTSRFTGMGAVEEVYQRFEQAYLEAPVEMFAKESPDLMRISQYYYGNDNGVSQFSELYGRIAGIYGDFERKMDKLAVVKVLDSLVNTATLDIPDGLKLLHHNAKQLVAAMLAFYSTDARP